MALIYNDDIAKRVALRKESVDRNTPCGKTVTIIAKSLSARRAWIEIFDVYIIHASM